MVVKKSDVSAKSEETSSVRNSSEADSSDGEQVFSLSLKVIVSDSSFSSGVLVKFSSPSENQVSSVVPAKAAAGELNVIAAVRSSARKRD